MNVEIEPELGAKLKRMASQQGRDAEDLVHEALERFVDYDEWFMREVEKGLAALRPLAPIFYRWLFGGVETLYRQLLEDGSPTATMALRRLRIDYECVSGQLRDIPASGPAIVISNHPYGVLDGLVLGSMLLERRSDVKFLGSYMAASIAQVRNLVIPVDFFGADAERMNQRAIRQSIKWLRSGGLLVVFPAADVGSRRWPTFDVVDNKWKSTPALMAKWTGAPVIPVFFHGANSWSFYATGLIHRELRDALVARELIKKTGQTIRLAVGRPIDARALVAKSGLRKATQSLRNLTFQLRNVPA